jgi:hypothetical protein
VVSLGTCCALISHGDFTSLQFGRDTRATMRLTRADDCQTAYRANAWNYSLAAPLNLGAASKEQPESVDHAPDCWHFLIERLRQWVRRIFGYPGKALMACSGPCEGRKGTRLSTDDAEH